MGSWSMLHWIMVLLVVLLLFGGGGKLRSLGEDLGLAIKGFKKGIREGSERTSDSEEIVSSEPTRLKQERHQSK